MAGYVTAHIDAVDYDAQTIALPNRPGYAKAFTCGRSIRIFNDDRSAQFRIVASRTEADRLLLSLDHTALFARGPVRSVADGRVDVDAHLTFAAGDVENRQLKGGPYAFAGTQLGEGNATQPVAGATRDGSIMLKNPVPARTLADTFAGRVVSVWLYAPGDSVEVANVDNTVPRTDSEQARFPAHRPL